MVGVALIGDNWSRVAQEQSSTNASGVCLKLLDELLSEVKMAVSDATAFAADIGPGSFIGVRVSATLAKTMAFALGKPCYVASSFDLIDPNSVVSFPSKKGEWFVREPGSEVVRVTERPKNSVGFGTGVENPVYPNPLRFGELIAHGLEPVDPFAVVPEYLIEPSISTPKPIPGVHA